MESEFKDRLGELIGTESVRSFAMRAGVAETTLRQHLSGRSEPNMSQLIKIASTANVQIDWLATGELPKEKSSPDANTPATPCICMDEFNEEYVLIPGYHLTVSTGSGSAWNGEQVKRHLAFRRKWLKYRGLNPERLAVVFAKGDSMQPTINNGDSILVDTSKNQVVDGSIFVLRLGDDLYAKRLQKNIDGGITVISDNRTEYPIQVVHPDQMDSLAVIGKVVWVGHDFL
jgi:phage repressor protein C with HTH and peptisase S24 domain